MHAYKHAISVREDRKTIKNFSWRRGLLFWLNEYPSFIFDGLGCDWYFGEAIKNFIFQFKQEKILNCQEPFSAFKFFTCAFSVRQVPEIDTNLFT